MSIVPGLHWRLHINDRCDLHADHNNLVFLSNPLSFMPDLSTTLTSKVLRWAVRLSTYNHTCLQIKGDEGVWADLIPCWFLPLSFVAWFTFQTHCDEMYPTLNGLRKKSSLRNRVNSAIVVHAISLFAMVSQEIQAMLARPRRLWRDSTPPLCYGPHRTKWSSWGQVDRTEALNKLRLDTHHGGDPHLCLGMNILPLYREGRGFPASSVFLSTVLRQLIYSSLTTSKFRKVCRVRSTFWCWRITHHTGWDFFPSLILPPEMFWRQLKIGLLALGHQKVSCLMARNISRTRKFASLSKFEVTAPVHSTVLALKQRCRQTPQERAPLSYLRHNVGASNAPQRMAMLCSSRANRYHQWASRFNVKILPQ